MANVIAIISTLSYELVNFLYLLIMTNILYLILLDSNSGESIIKIEYKPQPTPPSKSNTMMFTDQKYSTIFII